MRHSTAPHAALAPKGANRRRTPRLPVEGILAGFLVTEKARMDIRDLSFGGFAAEAECVLEKDRTYDITFLPPIGENVMLKARVVYCRQISPPGRPIRFFGGFEFEHAADGSRPAVTRLMNRIAALLGFGERPALGGQAQRNSR
jgi:hypothetical protein